MKKACGMRRLKGYASSLDRLATGNLARCCRNQVITSPANHLFAAFAPVAQGCTLLGKPG
jgi:hypothetical protein